MPETYTPTPGLEYRAMIVRAVDPDARTVTGIAVPYDTPTDIGGWYTETIARGAVQDSDSALLFWRHSEPIGRITTAGDSDAGWEITARISETPRGDEAYTLLRDGVVTSMSIGFEPLESLTDETTGDVTRTAIKVREVSLVPFPAYDDAVVTAVRHRQPPKPPTTEENTMPTEVIERADLDAINARIEDLDRGLDTRLAALQRDAEPVRDTRSAGQVLKALIRGDEATVSAYEQMLQRDYTGGTTADSILLPQWVGDLTRLIGDSSVLPSLFSTGTLPTTGNSLEYGKLLSNTITVDEQAKEGDDLSFGKVSLTTATVPVKTFGGYTTLSRQEIERSSVNVLDANLRALALEAGRRRNTALRAFLAKVRAAQVAADSANARKTVTVADQTKYTSWVGGIIDAAGMFEDLALTLDALLVDKETFKTLAALEDSAGRPLMVVYGTGVNAVGAVQPAALGGNLAGVTVRVDPKQAAAGAQFVNKLAIRAYNSPVVSLTDANVVNLSNDYSVYFYAALADEVPDAVLPVVSADPAAAGA